MNIRMFQFVFLFMVAANAPVYNAHGQQYVTRTVMALKNSAVSVQGMIGTNKTLLNFIRSVAGVISGGSQLFGLQLYKDKQPINTATILAPCFTLITSLFAYETLLKAPTKWSSGDHFGAIMSVMGTIGTIYDQILGPKIFRSLIYMRPLPVQA